MLPPKKHGNDARKCFLGAMGGGGPAISLSSHSWLIIIFLSLTGSVTNTLLARTELLRRRTSPRTAGRRAGAAEPSGATRAGRRHWPI